MPLLNPPQNRPFAVFSLSEVSSIFLLSQNSGRRRGHAAPASARYGVQRYGYLPTIQKHWQRFSASHGRSLGLFVGKRCFGGSLVGQPFGPVGDMHDAAIDKPVFSKNVLQDFVVGMSVGSEIVASGYDPGETGIGDTPARAVGGQSVYGGVGAVVEPGTRIHLLIVGVFARHQGKGADHPPRRVDDAIAVALCHILPQRALRRIPFAPLRGISRVPHIRTGPVEYPQQDIDIFFFGFPYLQHLRFVFLQK